MAKVKDVITLTPQICSNFSGNMGDTVNWQSAPSGCQIQQAGSNTWPFTKPSPITFPITNPADMPQIASGLTVGKTYSFTVTCCLQGAATHTVKVNG
jgi:hypothetical protein